MSADKNCSVFKKYLKVSLSISSEHQHVVLSVFLGLFELTGKTGVITKIYEGSIPFHVAEPSQGVDMHKSSILCLLDLNGADALVSLGTLPAVKTVL